MTDSSIPDNEVLTDEQHMLAAAGAMAARRVSHEDLMAATACLRRAYQKELRVGQTSRAREINQLILGCYVAAIRVEDMEFPS